MNYENMFFKYIILLMGTVIYRQEWTSAAPEFIRGRIEITDMNTYVEGSDPEYRMLTGTGMRLKANRVDDVHDPIWSQMLQFSFRNDNNTYLHKFSRGHDKRWYTRFYYDWRDPITELLDNHEVFAGFLNMDDNTNLIYQRDTRLLYCQ